MRPANPYLALLTFIRGEPVENLSPDLIWEKAREVYRRPDDISVRQDIEDIALKISQEKDTARSRIVFAAIGKDTQ